MKQALLFIWVLITVGVSSAQSPAIRELMAVDAFIAQVKQNHPVAKQASLQVAIAEAALLTARGNFDPTLQGDFERKTFDKKNYFNYWNPELKVPTWIGADIKYGLESNSGTFLNSESTAGNTSYFGIEMPVARGLLMDKRRAAVLQAKQYRNMSEQERLKMLNDLLFDAYVSYYTWAGSYQLFNTYNRFLQIANERLRFVRIAFQNGDRSPMDTLEAWTQVQTFRARQAEAFMRLNTSRLDISAFLWLDQDSAVLLSDRFYPDTTKFNQYANAEPMESLITQAMIGNPSLRAYDFKLNSLEIERKLKFQSFLPYVDLKYNLLNKDYYAFKNFGGNLLENNYKYGLDFKIPLFLREGRGDYRKAKLKIQETKLELNNKRWETELKVRNYYNETFQLQNQLDQYQQNYVAFNTLLRNEELRFTNGESSLFMINSRENKVMETQEKLVELRIKYFKSYYAIQWAAGILR
ncbi:MAG TPA: hypothetical protein DIW54_14525 [Chitinophagaceae bacterium]|nr:hypothetical protein [Chitinophagaceae bacterium]HCT24466.1 hypothetical protein [Chitinophagaceae bacterium]